MTECPQCGRIMRSDNVKKHLFSCGKPKIVNNESRIRAQKWYRDCAVVDAATTLAGDFIKYDIIKIMSDRPSGRLRMPWVTKCMKGTKYLKPDWQNLYPKPPEPEPVKCPLYIDIQLEE